MAVGRRAMRSGRAQRPDTRLLGGELPVAQVHPGSERRVGSVFRQLLADGMRLRASGAAKQDPQLLLRTGYTPKYQIDLFGARFFLCNQRVHDGLKLLPAYVIPSREFGQGTRDIYARAFYKDSSLVWRSASHYINDRGDAWVGKGALKWVNKAGLRGWYSAEETTNLPYELQAALDEVSRRGGRTRTDHRMLGLFLRNAPAGRIEPYQDFLAPRERAMAHPADRINRGRSVAWFEDHRNPASLRFEPGYEPDFSRVLDVSVSRSSMYGGPIRKCRIASTNGLIQYLFVAGPKHVWIIYPQAMTRELSSYGLRTVDVVADEDLCIPGYEFFDEAGEGEADDQIPEGFAGEICPVDPDRADASPWNDQIPVIKTFRRLGI